jgi:hypothetical protein
MFHGVHRFPSCSYCKCFILVFINRAAFALDASVASFGLSLSSMCFVFHYTKRKRAHHVRPLRYPMEELRNPSLRRVSLMLFSHLAAFSGCIIPGVTTLERHHCDQTCFSLIPKGAQALAFKRCVTNRELERLLSHDERLSYSDFVRLAAPLKRSAAPVTSPRSPNYSPTHFVSPPSNVSHTHPIE